MHILVNLKQDPLVHMSLHRPVSLLSIETKLPGKILQNCLEGRIVDFD